METYPDTLPAPDISSYSGIIDWGLIRSGAAVPAPRQLKGYGRETNNISMSFSMENDTYTEWLAWVQTYGYEWFLMPVISEYNPVDLFSTHRVRFTTPIQYTKRGDNWLSVSIGAEILQGDKDDALAPINRVYNVINGGSPSAPSVDIINAGTPSNPSTDIITGSIYAYTLE